MDLNGQRAKPSKLVQPGDSLKFSRGDTRMELCILGLSQRRLGAALASELYRETEASIQARQQAAAQRRARDDSGKPDKRARRLLKALKDAR